MLRSINVYFLTWGKRGRKERWIYPMCMCVCTISEYIFSYCERREPFALHVFMPAISFRFDSIARFSFRFFLFSIHSLVNYMNLKCVYFCFFFFISHFDFFEVIASMWQALDIALKWQRILFTVTQLHVRNKVTQFVLNIAWMHEWLLHENRGDF